MPFPRPQTDAKTHHLIPRANPHKTSQAIIGDLPRPKTKSEYMYVIVELIFGLILFAWVLGHVANIVTNVSAARKEFQGEFLPRDCARRPRKKRPTRPSRGAARETAAALVLALALALTFAISSE